jgi:Ca2+-binding EF-hand superfamily protein
MSVARVGNAGAVESTDPSKMASKVAAKMMSELDTSKDGNLDRNEFVSGLTAKGVSATDAGKMFDAIDTKKKGSITTADIESAVKSGAVKPPAGGAPRAGSGKPPSGGSAGSSTSYDPADTNQDGTVTAQEALLYSMKHLSSTNSQKSALAKLGSNVDKLV